MKVAFVKIAARCATLGLRLSLAHPAIASEEIRYEQAPGWVKQADMAEASKAATSNLIVADKQLRIENGRLWTYVDNAYKISSPQDLSQFGTIVASWLPDKGDLIVHELSLERPGGKVDLIAGGARLDVLRREEALEQRILDGQLTATVPVPGLRVGDILRVRYSTTLSDQALGNEVEALAFLGRKPEFRPGFSRVIASWDPSSDVRYQAGPGVTLGSPVERDGFMWLDVELPLAKADDLPFDAPLRYRRPTLLQVGTFSGWEEVSKVMAPYYDVGKAIAPGSELDRRAAAIVAQNPAKLAQAVAALKLVQDDIGYLANGLEGGNYLPQSPQQTWDKRYGDCKAKTVLLLALLGRLGIESEAVLVSSDSGDAIPDLLPMPGVFDHVLVRAKVDGVHYWLDGTSAGASMRMVGNVPPFRYGLPIRVAGASIEPITQELPRAPDGIVSVAIDQTAGADIPALYEAEVHMFGPPAAFLNSQSSKLTQEERFGLGTGIMAPFLGPVQVYDVVIKPGADNSEAIVASKGFMTTPIKFTKGRGEQQFRLPSSSFTFSPDRARQKWRDLPVALGDAMAADVSLRITLPDKGRGFTLEGPTSIDDEVAGRHFLRSASLADGIVTLRERMESRGGEIAPEDIAEERRKAATLSRNALVLRTPAGVKRRWDFAGMKDRSALAAVEKAYGAAIDSDPDEVENYVNRARFRVGTFDFEGALADFTKAIELEKTADILGARAALYARKGDDRKALADFREAWELQPNPYRAMALASTMARLDDLDGALELLEEQDGNADVKRDLALALADIDAQAGRKDAGLERIEVLLADRPNDETLLNAKCWFLSAWQVGSDDGEAVCTKAVELASSAPPVLDSRALYYLRAGNYAKALNDAEAALSQAPEQDETLLLRGLIRLAQGDRDGKADIRAALARNPASRARYGKFGFDLD